MNAGAQTKPVLNPVDHSGLLQGRMEECFQEREALQNSQAREQDRINELNLIIRSCEMGLKPFQEMDTSSKAMPTVMEETPGYPRG